MKLTERPRRSILTRAILCLAAVGFLAGIGPGVRPAWSQGEAPQEFGGIVPCAPAERGKIQASPQAQRVFLEPFYFLREHQGRLQVERIIVVLDWEHSPGSRALDVRQEEVREGLYRIFQRESPDAQAEQQILALLGPKTGGARPPTVTIRRSFMILH